MKSRRIKLAPKASTLIESLRDVGYSLPTAVADIVDNSIAANAQNIHLLSNTNATSPAIGIMDDGTGMSEQELLDAMRPGSKNPTEFRNSSDLGRFGLGLKTASFSQCRRLTVVSRKHQKIVCAVWDLDTVAKEDDWVVELPDSASQAPWVIDMPSSGTLVIWEKLDRLLNQKAGYDQKYVTRQIDNTADHIELVFHKYLSGDIPGKKKVQIYLNRRLLIPHDPFNSKHLATQRGPYEVFQYKEESIRIQPFTLPHHSKVSKADWEKYSGTEGYLKNQGFYLYRNHRLIIHGTWFGLAKQSELTKLSRVQIDITNSLDAYWKIDIKKASAQIPPTIRDKLRTLVHTIGSTSKKVYTQRGTPLAKNARVQVWRRHQDKNQITYRLNEDHPAIVEFANSLEQVQSVSFRKILRLIDSGLPLNALFADISANPTAIDQQISDPDIYDDLVRSTFVGLVRSAIDADLAMTMMEAVEPFKTKWAEAQKVIAEISERIDSNA